MSINLYYTLVVYVFGSIAIVAMATWMVGMLKKSLLLKIVSYILCLVGVAFFITVEIIKGGQGKTFAYILSSMILIAASYLLKKHIAEYKQSKKGQLKS